MPRKLDGTLEWKWYALRLLKLALVVVVAAAVAVAVAVMVFDEEFYQFRPLLNINKTIYK